VDEVIGTHSYFPAHVTNGVDYSWLVGLIVSGPVYLVPSRSLDLTAEQAAITASEPEPAIDAIAEAATAAETEQIDARTPRNGE
jgi:hypothetical protein